MSVARTLVGPVLALALMACGQSSDFSESPEETALEASLTSINGLLDEQNGSGYSMNISSSPRYFFARALNEIWPDAAAASCTRARYASCVGGVRHESYSGCNVPLTLLKLDGQITLSYSDSGCSLSTTGQSVQRTFDLDIIGPRGGTLTLSSAPAADYRGTTYGGGGRLSKSASGWDVEIDGKHKSLGWRGQTVYSVSLRTLSAISVTGGLDRASRVVNGGSLEINHNRRQFTAIYPPNNLSYISGCCHPVSGTLSVVYSGSLSGTGSATFNGCGSVTATRNSISSNYTLSYCE